MEHDQSDMPTGQSSDAEILPVACVEEGRSVISDADVAVHADHERDPPHEPEGKAHPVDTSCSEARQWDGNLAEPHASEGFPQENHENGAPPEVASFTDAGPDSGKEDQTRIAAARPATPTPEHAEPEASEVWQAPVEPPDATLVSSGGAMHASSEPSLSDHDSLTQSQYQPTAEPDGGERPDPLDTRGEALTITPPATRPRPAERQIGVGDLLKGRFFLEEVIAEGGMGVVFKARDEVGARGGVKNPFRAIKMLGKNFKPQPEAWKALLSETEKTKNLTHPNIIRVYDFDHDLDWDEYFMTMEYLQGQSLDQLMRSNAGSPIESALAYRIVDGIAQALDYAHKQGIVHSDMKPSNVFLTQDGVVKVLDFGIARVVRRGEADSDKTVFGIDKLHAYTIAYASCEIIRGWPPAPCDDVYALACIAYKLLSGGHPFGREGETYGAEYARDAGLVPEPIKGLTNRQWRALTRGLAFARKDRTAAVQEFLEDIKPRSSLFKFPSAGIVLLLLGLFAAVAYRTHTARLREPPAPIGSAPKTPHPESGAKIEQQESVASQTLETEAAAPPLSPTVAPKTEDSSPLKVSPDKPYPPPPTPDEGKSQSLPKSAEQQLVELIPRLDGLGISLSQAAYRDNEPIRFHVDLPTAGNLHIFHFHPGEKATLIYPSALAPDNRVGRGSMVFPNTRKIRLQARPPYGKSWFIATLHPQPINLYRQYTRGHPKVQFVELSAEDLVTFLQRGLGNEQTKAGHAEMTACPMHGACE